MLLKFPATLDVKDYNDHHITKSDDLLCIRYDPVYRDKIRAELRKITDKNAKNLADGKESVQLDITVDIHYKKRSLDQNSWLWRAHEIEANIVNGKKSAWTDSQKIKWSDPNGVTPEIIHDSYMEQYAKRGYIEVEPGFVDAVRKMVTESMGRVMNEEWLPDKQKMRFEIWRTSSYMDVREFCELADHVVENLLQYGIDINNAVDYESLSADLQEIKNESDKEEQYRSVKNKDPVTQSSLSVMQDDPIKLSLHGGLTNSGNSINVVKEVFNGEIVREEI